MDRSDLIKEAVVCGLSSTGRHEAAQFVEGALFWEGARHIIARAPRSRLDPYRPAAETTVAYLREAIDDGLRQTGFHDIVVIEP